MDKSKIYALASKKYGINYQNERCVEECLELAQAILKLKRSDVNHIDTLDNIAEEIADIQITTEQLIQNLNLGSRVNYHKLEKLKRLEGKVK